MGKQKVVLLKTMWPDTKVEEELLKGAEADVVLCPSPNEDAVIQYVGNADVIVAFLVKVTEKILEAAKKCKLVMPTGIGVDNIDVPAATRRGIYVANVPDYCIDEVSDHTLALGLNLQRKIIFFNRIAREGRWGVKEAKGIYALKGQTYGIVGLGKIGCAVAKKVQVFGFKVIAVDPLVSPEEAQKFGVELVDLKRLLETSDVISIHAPLSNSTYHMFNGETIGRMKNSAYLINVSRGSLVDQKALYSALKLGKIAGAAIDVMGEEPPKANEPLLTLDNVIITPHVASYSEASMIELREKIFREVARVLNGEQPKNWVNRKEMTKQQKN
ncbi:Hydroxypyruvate reductase [subsurface metagenome]